VSQARLNISHSMKQELDMTKKVTSVRGTSIEIKEANAITDALVLSANHEMLDPKHTVDAFTGEIIEGDVNPVSFADNPNYNRNAYINMGKMVAAMEKALDGTTTYINKLEDAIADENQRNGKQANTVNLDTRLDKAVAERETYAVWFHGLVEAFEMMVNRVWTGRDDFYQNLDQLFDNTATSTKNSIKPTKVQLKAAAKAAMLARRAA